MKKYDEFVNKIHSNYVKDDYLQIMLGYQNYLLLFGNNDLMYFKSYNNDVPSFVGKTRRNLYLEDPRRDVFPYSSIPEHVERSFLFRKINFANQILDFEKPYIRIYNGFIIKMTAFKDGDEAIIHSKILSELHNQRTKLISREELEKYLKTGALKQIAEEEYESTWLFDTDGRVYHSELESEQSWIDTEKDRLTRIIRESNEYKDSTKAELLRSISTLDTIEPFYIISKMMMIKFKANGEIKIETFAVKYQEKDKYEIIMADLPVTRESLSNIKLNLPIIKTSKEPKISLLLNPNVTKEQLQEEKSKILVRKK